jgi:hypothetical protein
MKGIGCFATVGAFLLSFASFIFFVVKPNESSSIYDYFVILPGAFGISMLIISAFVIMLLHHSVGSLEVKQFPIDNTKAYDDYLKEQKKQNSEEAVQRTLDQANQIVHRKGLKMIQEQRQENHSRRRKPKR